MPARTAEAAADDFVDAQRQVILCIARATVYGSGTEPSLQQTLTIWNSGQGEPDLLRLKTHNGVGEIILSVALRYMIEPAGIRAFLRIQHTISIASWISLAENWWPTTSTP